jgi:anthranilate synthase/aminodeoxychorismate synthase-like glutamine amidotransferase
MILLIDNYDSFTYNLEQMLREIHDDVQVVRNDQLSLDQVAKLNPDGIVLSPGPGHPRDAGICMDVIRQFSGVIPILGVCLGMQALAETFGGTVGHANEIVHGKAADVYHKQGELFQRLPIPFKAARYHSLCVQPKDLPAELRVEADTQDGQIMAIRHVDHPTFGLQFHPESILTEGGYDMLRAFVEVCHAA